MKMLSRLGFIALVFFVSFGFSKLSDPPPANNVITDGQAACKTGTTTPYCIDRSGFRDNVNCCAAHAGGPDLLSGDSTPGGDGMQTAELPADIDGAPGSAKPNAN